MQQEFPISKAKSMSAGRSERDDFFYVPGRLVLSDGTVFQGQVPQWQQGTFSGEVVFNTGMTGYIESLTDPSYAGQILVFTFPLIGNYGVDTLSMESDKIQVDGVIISETTEQWSHSGSDRSLLEWLKQQNIPILTAVDTRALTKHLRVQGTMGGSITTEKTVPKVKLVSTKFVSIDEPKIYNLGRSKKIILVDCGAKENIARSLANLGLEVKRVPHDYDYSNEDFDGVFVSNGPGDPTDYVDAIKVLKKALKSGKPVYGICLGNQLLALAAGGKTYKLKFGHRGHNQPCIEVGTNRAYITSQNHGYAIDGDSLPVGWEVSFRNLNDDSVEGIRHKTKPYASVQFHPEANPGPTDTAWFFQKFKEVV